MPFSYTSSRIDDGKGSSHEVLIQVRETCIQLPNEDDEAAEVVVVVDENLSVRATNTNANCLRTEEQSGRVERPVTAPAPSP